MNYCGIDLASKSSDICIVTEKGNVLRRRAVDTESSDIGKALDGFGQLKVIIEASPLAEMVARIIEVHSHIANIIDARAAKNLMSAMKKTDRRDAQTLAEIGRCGWYVEVHKKSAEARQMRSILQARQALLKSNKALGASIRGLLRSHGIRLGAVSKGQFASQRSNGTGSAGFITCADWHARGLDVDRGARKAIKTVDDRGMQTG